MKMCGCSGSDNKAWQQHRVDKKKSFFFMCKSAFSEFFFVSYFFLWFFLHAYRFIWQGQNITKNKLTMKNVTQMWKKKNIHLIFWVWIIFFGDR